MGRGQAARSPTAPTSNLISPLQFGFRRSSPATRAKYVSGEGQTYPLPFPHHVQRHVLAMDGQHYLLADVAEVFDMHDTTLRKLRWRYPEVFRGSYYARCGGIAIYLYTDGDLHRISKHLAERSAAGCGRRGRRRMWSVAEARERERAQLRTNYYRRRAEALAAKGDAAGAKTYLDRRETLLDSLREQSMLRTQELMATRTIGDGRRPRPSPAERASSTSMLMRIRPKACDVDVDWSRS
jgi:hypothetical protein